MPFFLTFFLSLFVPSLLFLSRFFLLRISLLFFILIFLFPSFLLSSSFSPSSRTALRQMNIQGLFYSIPSFPIIIQVASSFDPILNGYSKALLYSFRFLSTLMIPHFYTHHFFTLHLPYSGVLIVHLPGECTGLFLFPLHLHLHLLSLLYFTLLIFSSGVWLGLVG